MNMSGRRLLKVVAGVGVVTGGVVGGLYVNRPDLLVAGAVRLQRYRVGFRPRSALLDDGFVLNYVERGQPSPDTPTVLMLHGFSGNLDAAVPVVKKLSPDMHVIAVDAPGHGLTREVSDDDLRPTVMAQRLKQFLAVTGRDKERIHLVGWAMGGTIAGFYAAQYPDDLGILTILAPGMHTPVRTPPFQETIDGDTNVLLPVSEAERKRFWTIAKHKGADLPKPVMDYLENSKNVRRKSHVKVMQTMIDEAMGSAENAYIDDVSNIETPTQIIWGENDGIIHVSGADVLADSIGSSVKRKDVVPDAGHAFYAEEPHTLAALITAFQADYRIHGEKWKREQLEKVERNEDIPAAAQEDNSGGLSATAEQLAEKFQPTLKGASEFETGDLLDPSGLVKQNNLELSSPNVDVTEPTRGQSELAEDIIIKNAGVPDAPTRLPTTSG